MIDYYLDDFLDKPRNRLQMTLGNGSLDSFKEDAIVRLWQLDSREQIGDDSLKQRHVLYNVQV